MLGSKSCGSCWDKFGDIMLFLLAGAHLTRPTLMLRDTTGKVPLYQGQDTTCPFVWLECELLLPPDLHAKCLVPHWGTVFEKF